MSPTHMQDTSPSSRLHLKLNCISNRGGADENLSI